MRILLDECLPAELARYLIGHDVRTVHQEQWKGVENGELLALAATRFEAFLTIDKRLHDQQCVPATLRVVTLRARSNRIENLTPLVPEVLRVLESCVPGTSIGVRG